MKYIITENQIKNLIEKKFGLDLTDKIHMVTSKFDLPKEFKRIVSDVGLNYYLNKYGPLYLIKTPKNMYLAQPRGKGDEWTIFDTTDSIVGELDVMQDIGIEYLGLSIDDLINAYITD